MNCRRRTIISSPRTSALTALVRLHRHVVASGSRRAEPLARRCIQVAHPETAWSVGKEIKRLPFEIERRAAVVERGVDRGPEVHRRRPWRREARTARAVDVRATKPGRVAVA